MLTYFGHHGTKQFIRGKPIRLGFILWLESYQGAYTPLSNKYKHLEQGASVVLQHVDGFQDIPFEKYFDNFLRK